VFSLPTSCIQRVSFTLLFEQIPPNSPHFGLNEPLLKAVIGPSFVAPKTPNPPPAPFLESLASRFFLTVPFFRSGKEPSFHTLLASFHSEAGEKPFRGRPCGIDFLSPLPPFFETESIVLHFPHSSIFFVPCAVQGTSLPRFDIWVFPNVPQTWGPSPRALTFLRLLAHFYKVGRSPQPLSGAIGPCSSVRSCAGGRPAPLPVYPDPL